MTEQQERLMRQRDVLVTAIQHVLWPALSVRRQIGPLLSSRADLGVSASATEDDDRDLAADVAALLQLIDDLLPSQAVLTKTMTKLSLIAGRQSTCEGAHV